MRWALACIFCSIFSNNSPSSPYLHCFFCLATAETGDEESVTRAKYFIRDEFLVSTAWILI